MTLPDHFFMEDVQVRHEYKRTHLLFPDCTHMFPADMYSHRVWTIHHLLKGEQPKWDYLP